MIQRETTIDIGKTQSRDNTFDMMKCIGILAVIIGHLTTVGEQFIFSWHMPLFFIIAGYFYHERNVKDTIVKDVKHLLLPYLVTCLAIISYYSWLSVYNHQDLVSHWLIASLYGNGSLNHTSKYFSQVPIIGAIWFLWALFWCKNIFNVIYKVCRHYYFLVCLTLAIIAILIDRYLINLPFAILPGISATLFYAIGCKIRETGGFKTINLWIVILSLVTWVISFVYFKMSMVRCFYENYPVNVFGACGGTYAIWAISLFISKTEGRATKFIVWIGRNSMTFLCIHLFDLDVYTSSLLHVPSTLCIPYVILLCILGTYIMSKIPLTRKIFNIS